MSSSACSQETRSKLPSARRRSGWVTRSGSFCTAGHRDPLRTGEALRQRMVAVRAQLDELAVLHRRHEAAERLADPAVGDVLLGGHGRHEATIRMAALAGSYTASSRSRLRPRSSCRSTVRGVSPV